MSDTAVRTSLSGSVGATRNRPGLRGKVGALVSACALIGVCGSAMEISATEASNSVQSPPSINGARHPRENTFMKRQWGVEVLYVRQTAAGYMLEFRYEVLDAQKAKPLFERKIKPILTHVESGATFVVPTPAKTGALRNSNPPIDGHTYWMFFANPGRYVKKGDHVNIQIGDFHADGVIVQ